MRNKQRSGIIAWFATNPVAANLLMLVIIVIGLYTGLTIKRSMMPEFTIDMVQITMAYPGAAPEEVEKGIVLKIEESLSDLEGIERIQSEAMESLAHVYVEPDNEDDVMELMNNIKTRIDAIAHFPEGAEKPIVGRIEIPFNALTIQIWGDLDERSMKELAEEIRLELIADENISSVDIWGGRDFEIAVEISEERLREYHLTLGQVANIIATSSIDLPGGSVRTENGDIMLRTQGQAYEQGDFETIVLKTFPDGTRLTLGEIANINDGFTDTTGFAVFNGKYSIGLPIMAMGEHDILKAATAAHEYVERKNARLPEGVQLTIWQDSSYYLNQRLGMMMKNLGMGAIVVFLVLALFLDIKLAFWVMVGIPICFLGSIALFGSPLIGGTLNIISVFGFILVLGIVVDDAIIIGESAFSEQEAKGHSVDAIISGVHKVATPATFGVLTTIVAFMPTLFIEGGIGNFGEAIGWVVIFCLAFSLVESKWILPAHLAHTKPATSKWLKSVNQLQASVNRQLKHFIHTKYRPLVEKSIDNRYMTVSIFLSMLILTIGLLAGGQVRFVMAPEMEGEFIDVELRMAEGTPQSRTLEAVGLVSAAIIEVEADWQAETGSTDKLVQNTFAYGRGLINASMVVELTRAENRSLGTTQIMRLWRDKVGEIAGAEVLSFSSEDGPSFGADISLDLTHSDWKVLQAASEDLETKLKTYDGLYDIQSSASVVADEFHIDILPQAEALGITRYDLGTQIRHAFHGAEAQRIQRGTHEIKVMVRYPREDRRTTASLDSMFIRTPEGIAVPFNSVASLEVKPGLSRTTHIGFQRAVEVTAEAESDRVEPGKITNEIVRTFLPELTKKYPGLGFKMSGMSEEENKMIRSMSIGFSMALFGIYALLAIPTKSYLQPLIIMGVIPFGIIGAVIGHMITGYAVGMMSLLGIIALSGVVVNDSLIMVDYVNKARARGTETRKAVIEAGSFRFRAILLTSLTTFFGLVPILLEKSVQAQVIVPMAISLAFGIVFATVITLLLVPCLYMILQDLGHLTRPERRARPRIKDSGLQLFPPSAQK
ncbi:efflux RND transporter permease subunit [Halieaceae bacterium IMCC14734]|uniref:Efflux RND transporter permease subunit n=1 Tax=Candidatus Litorirhabdus singularis TaxID=2518993 RepID=A0ABT3TAF8_9GAMM|nr:efflux RND transporter permease subunit [Candidatus Litorirhabdus singularis]MCX2979257.1 efflux RND transporter permease subunit [Candidatus Litorirhabdus singularis]